MKALFQHTAITHGIAVRVAVSFLEEQSQPDAGKWFWVYHIRIENHSHEQVQLISRHWRITDGRGKGAIVQGHGGGGERAGRGPGRQPEYHPGCPLDTPHGSMEGFYTFMRDNNEPLEVRIPFFPLAAPATAT